MATEPRSTEIDSAEDMTLLENEGEGQASSPVSIADTEDDTAESGNEPLVEPVDGDPSSSILDEEGVSPNNDRKSDYSILQYYVVPVVGVVLIMSLGWTLAFLARRGLEKPAKPIRIANVKTKKENRVLSDPKPAKEVTQDSRMVRLPRQEIKEDSLKERKETSIARINKPSPQIPASSKGPPRKRQLVPSLGSAKSIETEEALIVPVKHPFFIPLQGMERSRERNKDTKLVFLRFTINLLVSDKAAVSEFKSKRALIRELIYSHYARLSPRDISTPGRRQRVRRGLLAKLDRKIIQGKVQAILFQEFFTR